MIFRTRLWLSAARRTSVAAKQGRTSAAIREGAMGFTGPDAARRRRARRFSAVSATAVAIALITPAAAQISPPANVVASAERLNWRVQHLILHP